MEGSEKRGKLARTGSYLWGTWDRLYSFSSAIMSILSVGITSYLWKYPNSTPQLIITRDIFVLFSLITLKTSQILIGRAGQPQDVAALIPFLASDKSSFIIGQVVHINGGAFIF